MLAMLYSDVAGVSRFLACGLRLNAPPVSWEPGTGECRAGHQLLGADVERRGGAGERAREGRSGGGKRQRGDGVDGSGAQG